MAGFTPATSRLHEGYFSAIARMRCGDEPERRPGVRLGRFAGPIVLGVVRMPAGVPLDERPEDLIATVLQPLIQT